MDTLLSLDKPVRVLVGIPIGAYAEIVEIVAPDSAVVGSTVDVQVTIKNISQYHYTFRTEIRAVPDIPPDQLIFSTDETIFSGASKVYNASFTMPDSDTTVLVWLERWAFDHWEYDGSASKVIATECEAPPGWTLLAVDHVSIDIPGAVGWVTLATDLLTINIPEVVGWVTLATDVLAISVAEVISWVLLAEDYINIATEVIGWVLLAEDYINIAAGEKFDLMYHHEYPEGKTYVGEAEECTTTFTVPLPEQLFPNTWVVDKIAATFADEMAKEGGVMLDIKIYQDSIPLWQTNYKVVAIAHASPFPWVVVIPLILAILLVVAITMLIVEFKEIDWGEIPTAIPWAILAVAVGVGVLGVGAAAAIALPRAKE